MTIQEQIRHIAAELNITVNDQIVNRVAGTVRFAKIRTAQNLDPLIKKELMRLFEQARELPTVEAHVDAPAQTFQQIDASLQNKVCPRCGKKMRDVLLADYTPAIYCEGECRITLWSPAK